MKGTVVKYICTMPYYIFYWHYFSNTCHWNFVKERRHFPSNIHMKNIYPTEMCIIYCSFEPLNFTLFYITAIRIYIFYRPIVCCHCLGLKSNARPVFGMHSMLWAIFIANIISMRCSIES